jgi:hypothetical protein
LLLAEKIKFCVLKNKLNILVCAASTQFKKMLEHQKLVALKNNTLLIIKIALKIKNNNKNALKCIKRYNEKIVKKLCKNSVNAGITLKKKYKIKITKPINKLAQGCIRLNNDIPNIKL